MRVHSGMQPVGPPLDPFLKSGSRTPLPYGGGDASIFRVSASDSTVPYYVIRVMSACAANACSALAMDSRSETCEPSVLTITDQVVSAECCPMHNLAMHHGTQAGYRLQYCVVARLQMTPLKSRIWAPEACQCAYLSIYTLMAACTGNPGLLLPLLISQTLSPYLSCTFTMTVTGSACADAPSAAQDLATRWKICLAQGMQCKCGGSCVRLLLVCLKVET